MAMTKGVFRAIAGAVAAVALTAGSVAAHDMDGGATRHQHKSTGEIHGGYGAEYSHNTPRLVPGQRRVIGERYEPTIWVDPDGCEHWVMDDGAEGYMTPHTNRHGIPVCRTANVCGVMPSDQLFHTDSHHISGHGRAMLEQFFRSASATGFIIAGHTDSRASDGYNMRLSQNRANSVARVGQATGARILDIRGYGERVPKASNASHAGMAANRRVEIICVR